MNKYALISLKSLYYLFPRVVREQYVDSVRFYCGLISRFSGSGFKVKKVELVSEVESLCSNCDKVFEIEGRNTSILAPNVFIEGLKCTRQPISSNLYDLKFYRLRDVFVLGETDAVIYKNRMYHQELYSMGNNHDLKQPDIFNKNKNKNKKDDWDYKIKYKNNILTINDTCISLLKEHSSNYYHCLTEIATRLVALLENMNVEVKIVNILVDENVPTQAIDCFTHILNRYKKFEYQILTVEKGQLIRCRDLVFCTPTWLSLDNTKYLPNVKSEFLISSKDIELTRSALAGLLPAHSETPKRRIYLQRDNRGLRTITNIAQVERLLYKYNFEFVNPAHLSFLEQVELFSKAEIVIGASGAAFTNLLFMAPSSKAILLYPSAQCTNYYIFQPLADASGVELIHVLTVPEDTSGSLHGDASVNIQELQLLLNQYVSQGNISA